MTDPYNPYDPNAQQPQYNQGYGAAMPGVPGGGAQKPDNYLLWTILSTLLCCLPLGAVGIYFSLEVDKNWEMGAVAQAEAASRKAKNFAIASAVSIAILLVLYLILFVFVGVMASTGTTTY